MTNVIQPVPGAKVITLDGTELVDILGGSVKGIATTQAIANLVTAGNTSGNSHVIGNLTVDGNSTLTGTVGVTGNLTTGNIATTGLLAVTGNETVSGNLTVTTNATVTGNETVSGNLTVTTNETVGGTLGVTGLATFTLQPRLPESNIAGAGTVLGNATQVVAGFVTVSGADGTVGVKLPATPATGTWTAIKNNAGAALKVYPDAAATINAIGSNGPISMAANTTAIFFADSTTQWWTIPLLPS